MYYKNYDKIFFVTQEKGYGHWKYTKLKIKKILDEKHSSKYEKILKIESLLEDYKERYLK